MKFHWRLDFRQELHLLWAERTIGYFVTQYWNSLGVYSQRLKCFLLTWNKVVILVIHYFLFSWELSWVSCLQTRVLKKYAHVRSLYLFIRALALLRVYSFKFVVKFLTHSSWQVWFGEFSSLWYVVYSVSKFNC